MLQNYFDTFVQESLTFIEELETINGNEVIFLEHIQKCTLRTSFDTMFGIKMDTNTINETLKTVNSACNGIGYRFRNLIMSFDFPFNFTSIAQIQQNNIAFWKTLSDKIIQQWASKMNTTTANSDTAYNRFLDILMNSSHNKQFTQKDIHFNIITLLTGSYASTAVTINFATFMLANFSEIQEKVYKELLEIYGTKTPKDAPIKYEDLERMHYLTCVIKETLRLFPTFPLIGRYLETDLKIGNNIIPKGTNISISILQMHRDETYWPNPLKFDPERFLPQNLQNSELSCYMPFSSGPRNCIGEKYAMMGMKVILATLIRTFVFKVNEIIEIDKIKLNMNTELITLEPLKIIVKTRNL
ncbi:cytochrome P450 3A19 isoform X2 [Monomorium pharaonis]|nr:cytochrome P450 3A19 isoform X2 [Monomorium pharaonis]